MSPDLRAYPVGATPQCDNFKQLGTVSDYVSLLDVLSKFQAWKQNVMGPLVEDLRSSQHNLTSTNHLLRNLNDMVNSAVATSQFDDLVTNVDSQLRVLDANVKSVRGAPEKLLTFRQKTMQRMVKLRNDYTQAMKQVQNVVNPVQHHHQDLPTKPHRRKKREKKVTKRRKKKRHKKRRGWKLKHKIRRVKKRTAKRK
jgi:hypothetical protein